MEETWKELVTNLPLDKQWHELYKRNEIRRKNKKAIWSGGGLENQEIILPGLFKKLEIKTMIDLGCADHYWLSKVDLNSVDYTGVDIVPELIEKNKKKFKNKTFINANLVEYEMPKSDLIFIRDVLVHLKFKDCLQIIQNIKKSGSKYLMISSDSNEVNYDNTCIILYPRNLLIDPFNFSEPALRFNDKNKVGSYMGVWEIEDLN